MEPTSAAPNTVTAWSRVGMQFARHHEHLVVASGLLALFALAWHHMAILGDGFWYIATGRAILNHGGLPSEDPFCFATVRDAWTIVSAGSCVLFALIVKSFGLQALLLFSTFVEWCATSLLWLSSSRRSGTRLLLLPLVLVFIQVDSEDLSARGQLFGDLGFVVLLLLMRRLQNGLAIAWFVPICVGAIWVNLHLSFLLAIFVPWIFAVAILLERREHRVPLRPFAQFSILILIGSVANPHGYRYLPFALRCATDPIVATFDLFQSPNFQNLAWLLAPVAALALVVVRVAFGPIRGSRADSALLLAFLFAACSSRRYMTQLLALEVVVAGSLSDQLLESWCRRHALGVWVKVACGLCLVMTSLQAFFQRKDPLQHVPALAAQVVTSRALPQNVMNPYHWGGYLAFAWNGSPKYFIDGRDIFGLVANGILDDSSQLRSGASGWERILDAYEIKSVLWERNTPLERHLAESPAWELAHRDRLAVVYVKRKTIGAEARPATEPAIRR